MCTFEFLKKKIEKEFLELHLVFWLVGMLKEFLPPIQQVATPLAPFQRAIECYFSNFLKWNLLLDYFDF
jgi:hypothetical protein